MIYFIPNEHYHIITDEDYLKVKVAVCDWHPFPSVLFEIG
jgi:hypothetical protein